MVFTLKKPFSLHRAIKGLLNEVKLCTGFTLQNIHERRMLMTSNQIKYWDLQERTRNNKAVERETNRSNLARETETNRANLAREREIYRANRVSEYWRREEHYLNARKFREQMAEQKKMNAYTRDLQTKQLDETKRSNLANESNRALQARADYNRAVEQSRHDQVVERQAIYQQAEARKVNDATIAREQQKVSEQIRYNIAEQGIKTGNLSELQRSHLAQENIQRFQNTLSAQHMLEEQRHNRISEDISKARNQIEVFKTTLHEANSLFQTMTNQLFRTIPSVGGVK